MSISRRSLSWLVAVGLLALAAPDAGGQAVPLPGTGTRVRLMESPASGHRITGSIVGSEGDTLRLASDAGDVLLIPASAFTRYEISRGVRSNLGRGLGFGALFGALGGVIVGLASADENSWVCSTSCSAVAGGVVFGGLGAIVGSIIGASSHRERWVQANSGAPLAVGLSLRW
jgi:hypothetical protein